MVAAFFLFWRIPVYLRASSIKKFDAEIVGVVDSIIFIKGIQESEIGGKVVTKSYQIDYQYDIEEKTIKQSQMINNITLSNQQKMKLYKLSKGDSVIVVYDSKNPGKSDLKIE